MEISTLNIKKIIIDIFEMPIFTPEFNLIIKHYELKLNSKKTMFILHFIKQIFELMA